MAGSPKGSRKKTGNPEGAMPLADHLRELRSRLTKSLIAIFFGMIMGWFYYDQLFGLIRAPSMPSSRRPRQPGGT